MEKWFADRLICLLRQIVFLSVNASFSKAGFHRHVFLFSWNKWKYDQWWEVKFVGEGIIDQGGGFRDSLAEIADELCPLDEHIPEILSYFIKTPNHKVQNNKFMPGLYLQTQLQKVLMQVMFVRNANTKTSEEKSNVHAYLERFSKITL